MTINRIKLIEASTASRIEELVNKWCLLNNETCKVKSINVSLTARREGRTYLGTIRYIFI